MYYSCDFCSYFADYQYELEEHEEEEHPSCNACQRMFRDHHSRRQHFLASSNHNYCGACDRHFSSPAALRGHEETHRPRDIRCPRCDRGFPSVSAMAKHAELGKCFGLTQQQWVKKVRDWELQSGNPNLLTVPRLGYSDDNASAGRIEATARSYNGRAFECYLCSREFGSLVSLNQHLNSGAHSTKDFRCKKCGFTATWLSGLIGHVETEKCGFMSRSQVRTLATPIAQLRLRN
ncbi:hypothetical protein M758_4G017700 [Ceratodon purpureus]|uniref:C2H2-type domain-containing protein n=1 Tax=Ceratodon purpureus TaxID=3225 RepID=A0A8T0I5W1_CERPU|nr:hypothetical protein KC19_4G019700 [Ceratodon purpureus]KAG0617823.1 hypothetical protein M758_4G017700 [Ceratodon purpureus]